MNFLEESCQGIEFEDLMDNREKQRAWLRMVGQVIGVIWIFIPELEGVQVDIAGT
jgi:hypothetical protein